MLLLCVIAAHSNFLALGQSITVDPSSSIVPSGDQFVVNIDGSGFMQQLYAFQFDVVFNPTMLQATGVDEGTFLKGGGATVYIPGAVDNIAGRITVTAGTLIGPVAGVTGGGTLAVLHFRALGFGEATVKVSNPKFLDPRLSDIAAGILDGNITIQGAQVSVPRGGAAAVSTAGTSAGVRSGYGAADVNSGPVPYGTAVISSSENGVVTSEVGIPASPPTRHARLFVEYRTAGTEGVGGISINTGIAVANPAQALATISYVLRNSNGQAVANGRGDLKAGSHFAKFVHELRDVAPDFNLPPDFPTLTRVGSLDITSDEPISVIGLRLTTNQRGEALLTSMPVADFSSALTPGPGYFPQLVDGGGYATQIILLNTSSEEMRGELSSRGDDGAPLTVRESGGISASTFTYSIPANGIFVFQTDGSPSSVQAGWVRVMPAAGSSTPVGAGVFSFSRGGVVVTQSGVPSANPTTRARIYVDKTGGHDTGLAIVNAGGLPAPILLQALQENGDAAPGLSTTLTVSPNGHSAKFVGEVIGGLPPAFQGVVEISSESPFAALTLRSLTNSRNDFLLTTFPLADLTRPAAAPIVFPQVVDGGGYSTEVILISGGGAAAVSLRAMGDDGVSLQLGNK